MRTLLFAVLLNSVFIAACGPTPKTETTTVVEKPLADAIKQKRIILFIGDGMGVGQLTATSYANGGPLNLMTMPEMGFATTHEYEHVTTDSAASATAIATGKKTHFNGVSVKPYTTQETESDPKTHRKTLFEYAKEEGLKTGLISTSRIVHATPAAFVAHRASRDSYEQVAEDLVAFGPDVFLGAGWKYFRKRKSDDKNLFDTLGDRGYKIIESPDDLTATAADPTTTKLGGLFSKKDLAFVTSKDPKRQISLGDMFDAAVTVLDRDNPSGWVLMVEGSFIDWCAHQLDTKCVIAETNDFDDAVGRGLAYAEKRANAGKKDTLVVATADHETGGMAVIDPYYAQRFTSVFKKGEMEKATQLGPKSDGTPRTWPGPVTHLPIGQGTFLEQLENLQDRRFTTVFGHFSAESASHWKSDRRFSASHTPVMVPIFAAGPGASAIAATRDNAQLGQALIDNVRGKTVRRQRDENAVPKKIILMVGDGMGLQALSAAQYTHGARAMTKLPIHGLVSTHARNHLVADSGATGTALATGVRSDFKVVGKTPTATPSILERASQLSWGTGLISDTTLTHATPAAFYAQRETRKDLDGIRADFLSFHKRTARPIDIVISGGKEEFKKSEWATLASQGYAFVPDPTKPELLLVDGDYPNAAKTKGTTQSLAALTKQALEKLKDKDAFVLVIEGGQIDWQLHGLDRSTTVLEEIVAFDEAVKIASGFAAKDGETLLVVTADHDHTISTLDNHYSFEGGKCGVAKRCGGPFEMLPLGIAPTGLHQVAGIALDTNSIFLQYAWVVQAAALKDSRLIGPHSANFVPLFAAGPGSALFRGFQDQPDVGGKLINFIR